MPAEAIGAASDTQATATQTKPEGQVSASEFGNRWPFTVSDGVLACNGSGGFGAVTFEADGTTYGLNGTALSQGLPSIDPIWKFQQPKSLGLRVSVSPLIDAGLKLCG